MQDHLITEWRQPLRTGPQGHVVPVKSHQAAVGPRVEEKGSVASPTHGGVQQRAGWAGSECFKDFYGHHRLMPEPRTTLGLQPP